MKKNLLSGIFLASSFLFFSNNASASEHDTVTKLPLESTDNIIYYNSDTQDILITDEVIIRTIESDNFPFNKNTFADKSLISPLNNGVWDLLGYEDVYTTSSVWYSLGGDFKVEVAQTDNGPVFYQLMEKDPYLDDSVGSVMIISGSKIVSLEYRNISSYVDDDLEPGLAEFYMKKLTHNTTPFLMAFYD